MLAATVLLAVSGCSVSQTTAGEPGAVARRPGPVDPVAELAARIPEEAARCVASASRRLDVEQRKLILLLSQTDTLPWGVEVPVLAYVRARLRSEYGSRKVAWLSFDASAGGPERIRAALTAATGARLRWPGEGPRCRDATDCADTRARFVAPTVVQLDEGSTRVALPEGSPDNACAKLRRDFPDALEVASWSHDPAFASQVGLVRTEQVLLPKGSRLTKVRRRTYRTAEHREQAYRHAQFGADELPVVAGIPVQPLRQQRGRSIEERADVLWDDLRLLVADDARERHARASPALRTPRPTSDDVDELRDQAQWMLLGLDQKPPSERLQAARMLSGWLLEVRRRHPADEGLAALQYRLFLDELKDPRSALTVADQVLLLGVGDARQWQLNRRRVLSLLGSAELVPALVQAHGLDERAARAMAEEVTLAVRSGGSFERAEWGFLAARELRQGARRIRTRAVEPVRLPLVTLPQTVAYLATRSPALRAVYGVHVWARGRFTSGPLIEGVDAWAALSAGGGEGRALVAAASSDQHAKLRELGTLLDAQLGDGDLELGVGLRPISGGEQGALHVVFEGRREGDDFVVRRMDVRTAALDWERIVRLLAEPLVRLPGRSFPPGELRVPAADAAEAARMVRWGQSEQGVQCHHVERWVVCRGPMHDAEASLRALLRMGDQVLGDESLRLWGRPAH